MKRVFRIIFLFPALAFLPVAALAQENVLKANALSPVVKTASLFYEYTIGRNSTLQLGLLYTGMSSGETEYRGFAFTPEYRYYFSKKKSVPKGLYLGGYFRYQNLSLSQDRLVTYTQTDGKGNTTIIERTETAEGELVTSGGGVVLGTQTIFKNRLTLDFFAGPGYNSGDVEQKDDGAKVDFETEYWRGITVRFGVAVGLAF